MPQLTVGTMIAILGLILAVGSGIHSAIARARTSGSVQHIELANAKYAAILGTCLTILGVAMVLRGY